ncbi:addiction module toxin RelE [Noviherbaspirillum sp. Root189]|nr:addiction module toxin RelE [Noviherbaspirillum sp. Root189]
MFKTKWFAKAAKTQLITDAELCAAIKAVMEGKADDLGGGVWKKRLNDNMHRSIIVAKGGKYWIYAYLFAKADRENIDDDELAGFKKLAKDYAKATEAGIAAAVTLKELVEICHDCK